MVPIIEFGATDQEETVARVKRKELIQTLADVLVYGATLECDRFKRIGDPSAKEVRSKKYKKRTHARIHDSPVLREYIQSRVSEPPDSQVHKNPKCETHGHFCLIFGNIAIFTNSSTLISKIIVAKLNSCVKMVFWGI